MSELEAEEKGGRRSMASKRQQELVSQKEEKEKKDAEKGPAWYYIPVGPKVESFYYMNPYYMSHGCIHNVP